MAEPFISAVSDTGGQQERLGDEEASSSSSGATTTSSSSSSRFHYIIPGDGSNKNDAGEGVVDGCGSHHSGDSYASDTDSERQPPSRPSSNVDLARRFFDEAFEDDNDGDSYHQDNAANANSDLVSFLFANANTCEDQDLSVMDSEAADYTTTSGPATIGSSDHDGHSWNQSLSIFSKACPTSTRTTSSSQANRLVEMIVKSGRTQTNSSDGDSRSHDRESWRISGRVKALLLLGCLLTVTSTLLAILEAPRHHQRMYNESYSDVSPPHQNEDASLWSSENHLRGVLQEQEPMDLAFPVASLNSSSVVESTAAIAKNKGIQYREQKSNQRN